MIYAHRNLYSLLFRSVSPSDPLKSPYISEVIVSNIYLLMGRELEELDEAPAGCIIGIGGLQQHVLKTATLSTTVWCPSFCELSLMATPILRVAVEPYNALDLPRLVKGLKLLNQSDACVQVIVQENGEHVLLTLGEVHLERCVADLETRYAKCKLNVSKPIVPFRETIVPKATVDMVNEAVVADKQEKETTILVETPNKMGAIKLLAVPLDAEIVDLLEASNEMLRALSNAHTQALPDRTKTALLEFKESLATYLQRSETLPSGDHLIDRVWSIGPKKCGTSVLLNMTDFPHQSLWRALDGTPAGAPESSSDLRSPMEHSFLNGFQLASLSGPLAEEPMHGVCFVVKQWTVDGAVSAVAELSSQTSLQTLLSVEKGCRRAFQAQPQRLVTPMYSCNIVVSADVLGKWIFF